jgi:thiol-disulfide isomerase/thioredoxin
MSVLSATDSDFNKHLEDNTTVVVKYHADWCGNCRLFAPKFKRVSNEEANQEVLFLDVDAEKNPDARKMAGVDNLPYLAVFKNGTLLEGSASSKEDYLRTLLEKAN